MSCGVGHRCGIDPVLLWLRHRPSLTGLIQPLAWEIPYAMGLAKKKKKKKVYVGAKRIIFLNQRPRHFFEAMFAKV